MHETAAVASAAGPARRGGASGQGVCVVSAVATALVAGALIDGAFATTGGVDVSDG